MSRFQNLDFDDDEEYQHKTEGNRLTRKLVDETDYDNYDYNNYNNETEQPDFKQVEEMKKPKSKKPKYQKVSLQDLNEKEDQWSKDISSNNNSSRQSTARKSSPSQQQKQQQLQKIVKMSESESSEDEYVIHNLECDNSFKDSIKQQYNEILKVKGYYKQSGRSEKEEQLITDVKNLYRSHIQYQIDQQRKMIEIELHYITRDNVPEIIDFCRKTILQKTKGSGMKTYQKSHKRSVHINFITGEGSNQIIYNTVKSYLDLSLYYIKENSNQGRIDAYLYI